jgi:hypothetical protein
MTNKTINIANNTLTGVQPTLVSGTSIKTINSQSLLGSGDIALAASPGGSTTQVQFNDAGVFAGSSAFTFSGTSIAVNGVTFGRGAGTGSFNAENTAAGASALAANSTGQSNTAFGFSALAANTTGSRNTAVGLDALASSTGSFDNTAVGFRALRLYTGSGGGLCAFGSFAMSDGNAGISNSAFGAQALRYCTINGYSNTAVGAGALGFNTDGYENTAIGAVSANANTTGDRNTAIGHSSLLSNTTGNYNVAVGYFALRYNTTGSGNTSISPLNSAGTYAPVFDPATVTGSDRFCMGSTGVTNAYIQVAWTVVSDARDKTDFAPVSHGLDFVSKLKPTAYRYKMTRESEDGHGPLRYGFKAQDVLELEGSNPVIVDAEDPEKLRFNDQSMIAVLVKAIQELKQQFDDYKASHP